ncbi:hypothetical protein [Nocardia callitridis]|uniref:Uncharacterized protein n=1 Tax=Nocardia callitridis TaxID=648753 RepID=A0ABP9KKT8_9NOCA
MTADSRYCHGRTPPRATLGRTHRRAFDPVAARTPWWRLPHRKLRRALATRRDTTAMDWRYALFLAPDAAGAIGNPSARPNEWEGLY